MPFFRRKSDPRFGYVRDKRAIADFIANTHKPFLAQQNAEIKGSGAGKQVRLMAAYEKVTGVPFVPHKQEIGDCVSHGFTLGAEVLSAVEIAAGQREEWRTKFSTEATYGLSRVEIGGGRIRGDGSTGAWGAKAVTHYGVLLRRRYPQYDLTKYDPTLAKRWGDLGVPDELESHLREHPIKTATLVTSYADAIDALANGYPIPVCSNVGFRMETDRDGFLVPRGSWAHCMVAVGFDDASERKGVEIINSWGDRWLSGPKHKLGAVAGGFWVDANVFDRMLKQSDSYSLSGFNGFPRRKIDYVLL